jgi:phthiocerol/phenolphthiocerol synthesis type-I polyketide synthase C
MQLNGDTHDPTQLLAVVGRAGRFPGAPDAEAFWRLLRDGGDAIGPVPADRWDATAPLDPEFRIQAVGGFLGDVATFDAGFFGISPREAEDMDPQQRLILETSWQALEDAGTRARSLTGSRTGVYIGATWRDYETLRRERGAGATRYSSVGNAVDVIAARVSYFLGLTGPSLTVETGCSSSLVALHLAGQALRTGEIDAALVGGVSLILTPDNSIGLTYFGGLSADGRCKAFGASPDGFVRGEGGAMVYVKTLARALADGDRVRAVVVRTAANNDGGGDSLVTPSPAGQEDLLGVIYGESGVGAGDLAYVEAHGTGTKRGDPIEAEAIGRVLGRRRGPGRGPLPIGSVKSNIGHLEGAAGMAGLFKVMSALEHRVVPPSLHAAEPNPDIPFDDLNLSVVREPLRLPADGPLLMGVNSFGWGGTNAHAIVADAPEAARGARAGRTREAGSTREEAGADDPDPQAPVLLPMSAHSGEALRERARQMAEILTSGAEPVSPVTSVAGTLAWQRDQFSHRAALVVTDRTEAGERLGRFADGEDEEPRLITGRAVPRGRTAFVFPGQGSQWAGMGRDLLLSNRVFADVLARCAEALAPHVSWNLIDVVSGKAGDAWTTRLDMIQPTLWAVSAGLAEAWRAVGVEPDVVVGHSQGEVTAATVAGILSYEDAALIIARRSAIARRLAGRGRMLAVDLDPAAAKEALAGFEDAVSLAVHNGPGSCVLSGDDEAVLLLKELLEADGTFCRLVNVDYASHSPQMDELKDDLLAALDSVSPRQGAVPLMSTVRVGELGGAEMDARYWVDNLRRPVLFAGAMEKLFAEGVTHVVEISPHPLLTPALERLAAEQPDRRAVLATLRRDEGTAEDLALAFAHGYVAGLEPFEGLPRRAWARLPAYPWQRRRYWIEQGRRRGARSGGWSVTLTPAVAEHDTWTGDLELSTDDVPWLRDHRIHDAVVVPAAAMMEMALRAGYARTGAMPRALTDVRFRSDLTLAGDVARVNVRWRDDITEGGSFVLSSLPEGATGWTEHATARAHQRSTAEPTPDFPEHLLDPAVNEGPAGTEEFYAACAAQGLGYGPAFQTLRSLHQGEEESLGEIRLNEQSLAGVRPHGLHPALWDGALQVCVGLRAGDDSVVPTAVERVHLHQDLSDTVTEVWSHAVRRTPVLFDLTVFDAARRPLMTIEGLRLESLAAPDGTAAAASERVHRLVFAERPSATEAEAAGTWLVCAHAAQAADSADQVRAIREHRDAGARADAVLAEGDQAAEPEFWTDRLRAAAERTGEPVGVVLLAPRAEHGLDEQRRGLLPLTALVRACLSRASCPRVAVVTTDAQAAAPGDTVDPGGALYWGFGRVLRREHPETRSLVLDLSSADSGAAACAAELLAGDDVDQVALRGDRRLTGRLARGEAGTWADAPRPPWRTAPQPFRLTTDRPGLWEGLTWRPLRTRPPGPGEIEVAVTASALNFIDVLKAMGGYPDAAAGADLLGGECAGRVTALGEGVTGVAVGDRVAACAFGSLASHVVVRADHARRIPEGMDDVSAAALPLVMATAWYGLHDLARLGPGETVLVHSAAGGLGLAAVQVARLLGAEVIATAGDAAKRAYLGELGVRHVFDSRDLAWADQVRPVTGGRGVDVVLNSLSGAAIPLGLDVLAEDGRFVEVGKKDIFGDRSIGLSAFRKGISLTAVDLAGLMARRPERFARLLAEVWERVGNGELAPLPVTGHRFADAAEALRGMSRGAHIGKIVLTDPATVSEVAPEPLPEGRFRADGTYLVTGGLGALGLSLAGFLADRGAGALVLMGRSEPDATTAETLTALRARGTRVETVAADVADAAALDGVLARVRAELPPLRGVFHAAGVLDDATIRTLRPEQVARVLAPKVDGARNLDASTACDPLDLFVMFSSAAALVGNAGQAAYAAGNAFMDALADSRRGRGLPGLSVQWGPFQEIGLAAGDAVRGARLEERGMGGFDAAEAWTALARFLERDERVVAYLPLDLRRWFDAYPDTAALPSWSHLREIARDGHSGTSGEASYATRLRTAPEAERRDLLGTTVRELAARVMRLDPKAIENDTPFKSLGLDSLTGLELRNRLEATLGLRLSPTLLWTYGNVRDLSGVLADRLLGGETAEAGVSSDSDSGN